MRNVTLHFCVSLCVFAHQRPDEEVVVDQGGTSSVLNIHYEKEELEGEKQAQRTKRGHTFG